MLNSSGLHVKTNTVAPRAEPGVAVRSGQAWVHSLVHSVYKLSGYHRLVSRK
jgi:hypothetical protein